MIKRFKALEKLDRKRLDAALMRIQGRPVLMTLFNLTLVAINSASHLKRYIKLALNKFKIINIDPATSNDSFNFLPEKFTNRMFDSDMRVLIVCEVTIPQCFRYRVEQKIEQLLIQGIPCKWLNWTDYFEVKNQIHFHDVIIFYRVPGYPKATANIDYANRLGKIVIYDTDDLIYDREILETYYNKSTGQLSAKELKQVLNGADLYKLAIQKCQYAITTTDTLKQNLERMLGSGNVFILKNALDKYSETAAQHLTPIKQQDQVTLFYGSGSKTHDEDFALISGVLAQAFEKHEALHLLIVGYLTLPEKLQVYRHRITQINFLKLNEYLHVLSHADINLAPLMPGLFADCKSEIKWLEAGVLKIPTITSRTTVYQHAITQGSDGYTAENEQQWSQILDELIIDENRRRELGEQAARVAKQLYSSQQMSGQFKRILDEIRNKHLNNNGYQTVSDNLRHIIVVNVLYPPLAMGGATVVAENIVNTLAEDYSQSFRVSVFTCDINNIYAYQIKEYEHRGVNVTSVSVPVGPDVDARAYDEYIEKIFDEYLSFQEPDLIHFHSIQRLTASMLQAANQKHIPFVVTVHDAWWLSDHQFLVDQQGKPVDKLQSNPAIAASTSADVQNTIHRSTQLKALLNTAEKVLAVSAYQADFYRSNGVKNVLINTNGINPPDDAGDYRVNDNKVVLGYSGSICHHKGYYFLKEALESSSFQHIKLKVIQFDLNQPKTEAWGSIEVEFLPKFDSSRMSDFYQQIDVLIAPSMWPESFGLITREAAYRGIWIIASDAGGLAEIVVPEENGFKFELGNKSQLINILERIDTSPQLYKQRVIIDNRNLGAINSVDKQLSELVGIYESVISDVKSN